MTRIGVTGHIFLTSRAERRVYRGLLGTLRAYAGAQVRGVTCLAEGADQLFARAVIAVGGTFEVILPSPDYRDRFVHPNNRAAFDRLLSLAADVSYAAGDGAEEEAFVAANDELLRRCDRLIAVWDGAPSPVPSATAQVVARAVALALPVKIVWPPGTERIPATRFV